MSTYDPVSEAARAIAAENRKKYEIRVNAYIHNISCENCDTIVTDCEVTLIGDSNCLGDHIIPPGVYNLTPVLVHQNQLFVRTGGIELSNRILKIVGLELANISSPIECDCIKSNKPPRYQLDALFPLCEHNSEANESSNTIMTFLKQTCHSPHSGMNDRPERYIGVDMYYNKEENTWESLPLPKIKVKCENLVKSAVKRHDIL